MLVFYLELTNYESLGNISQDIMFSRSLLNIGCGRNPQYYNKPGSKVHAMVDSLRTVLAYTISECTAHDSYFIDELFNNKYISDELL